MPHCDKIACQLLYESAVAEERADVLACVAHRCGRYLARERAYKAHEEAQILRREAIAAARAEEKGDAADEGAS